MNTHKYLATEGGCACGSRWASEYDICSSVLIAKATDEAKAIWLRVEEEWDWDTAFDCYRGHRGCTRC